jgi:hypothetical protein
MKIRRAVAAVVFVTFIAGAAAARADVGLPDKFPLPTYNGSGATNVQIVNKPGTQVLQYDVHDDMKAVVDWYRDRLKAQGFSILMDQETKDASGYTRGMVQWSRCENHHYAAVGVGSMASAGNPGAAPQPGAEISLEAHDTGC